MNEDHPSTFHWGRRRFLSKTASAIAGLPLAVSTAAAADRLFSIRPVQPVALPDNAARDAEGPGRGENGGIHVFSKHLQFLDYDEMAETAAEIGFDGVDLSVRPGGHVHPERVEDDLPRAAEAVVRAGLVLPMMVTAITDPLDPHTEPILRTASALGIREYRMGYLRYDAKAGIAERLDSFVAPLRELAAMNAEIGLHANYQNHDGTTFGAPVWDLWTVLDRLDTEWIGAQYDIRHATVEGGKSWPLGLRLMRPHIRTLVIKDFHWDRRDDGSWFVRNVPVGDGMVDFESFFRLVGELEIDVPLTMHFEYEMPEEDRHLSAAERRRETIRVMQRELEMLRALMKHIG